MASKSTPISVRITDDDAAFLASLELSGAATPSEKIRTLITRARTEAEEGRTYEASLVRIRELLEPTSQLLRARELTSRQRSELIADTLYWLPDLVAYLMAGPEHAPKKGDDGLKAFEAGVADRIFRYLEAVLRLAVTEKAPCYDPSIVSEGVRGTLELTEVILTRRHSAEGKKS
ncbi:MAG TPA: hypothetical protein VFQ84_11400 [Arenimonas sp.]|uniref:hypothetical protein n=1 Tax=Arenimonas sp. TaxID=1872635 RepID=UPI002D7E8ABD|nr:hypothetical protein [Arenimonas sp.]HEU0153935.1 hypothetical protein [Arenimonas sp.]